MKYWLTVHYPMATKDKNADWRYHIFLQRREDIQTGDLAFIYETKANPSYKEKGVVYLRPRGRKGVIALVKVIGGIEEHSDPLEELTDERKHYFNFFAETELKKECFIPLDDVRIALGWPWWCAVGHNGIWELTEAQFNELFKLT